MQLGVCTATGYRLVGEGQLAHVRVLNAIRVAPRDLAAFIQEARRPGNRNGQDARRKSAQEERRRHAEQCALNRGWRALAGVVGRAP